MHSRRRLAKVLYNYVLDTWQLCAATHSSVHICHAMSRKHTKYYYTRIVMCVCEANVLVFHYS